ncbi:hypothetical protein [Leptospira kmetyi]|uniref:Uncharacterized protein n=1 Tax=Leptospira kmetyi TaxID=408139 RepID=A0A2M9XVI7_9LEPT|nr:hypothetical protein [Leptospira kmetyi]AYV56970.1 hypothetical protein EFP84_16655 [Leptospira kmetyi]PJZ31696.1 hypothetical protein CH378_00320 [Leptospira kmetyi]PJZ43365.1 hypothetical protein CH370_02760 [Leptospira kmetyi]TGK21667.1 hypothetical protein EHO62_04445 [Leptospira kmetyi]TGK28594.1 hypothetical protein EHO66_13925 [Leptospira kmetyi]
MKSFVQTTLSLCILVFVYQCNLFTNYPITHLYPTKEEVVIKAIDALRKKDLPAIEDLILSPEEHNTMFWKHVGERFTSDPGMTPELAYEHMNMETNIVIKEQFNYLSGAGIDYQFKSVQCKRKPEEYGPFTLHLGCATTLLNPKDHTTITLHSFSTFLEYKGKYKLYHLKRE